MDGPTSTFQKQCIRHWPHSPITPLHLSASPQFPTSIHLTIPMGRTRTKKVAKNAQLSTATPPPSSNNLATQTIAAFGLAKTTQTNYDGYVNACAQYLVTMLNGRKMKIARGEDPGGLDGCEEPVNDVELAAAFKNPPNQYSALVVELFISHKCIPTEEGQKVCKFQTADSISSAMKKFWDRM